jgi:hypothetical protein
LATNALAQVRLSTWKANCGSLECRFSCLYAKNPVQEDIQDLDAIIEIGTDKDFAMMIS